MPYEKHSVEARLLSEDPGALGEVTGWIAQVLSAVRFWSLRREWLDLHQEILLRVIESLRKEHFNGSRDFRVYVQATARYTAIRSLAIHGRYLSGNPVHDAGRDSAVQAEPPVIARQLVRHAMDAASHECRNLFRSYFLRGQTYAEIAAEKGLPVGTVKSRLFRCLERAHGTLVRGRKRRVSNA